MNKDSLTHKIRMFVYSLDRISDELLQKKFQLTLSQYRMLSAISWKSHLCQSEIAKYHSLTPAAVSRQIDILEQKKLIIKKPNPKNRRQHLLFLSSNGLE